MIKNFSYSELACPCCGELPLDTYNDTLVLQKARDIMGCPLHLNSAHRCWLKNVLVGGAPLSMHKHIAFDISLAKLDRHKLVKACIEAGFTGFGYYRTFLHVDCGRPRYWYGKNARSLWNG